MLSPEELARRQHEIAEKRALSSVKGGKGCSQLPFMYFRAVLLFFQHTTAISVGLNADEVRLHLHSKQRYPWTPRNIVALIFYFLALMISEILLQGPIRYSW